MSDRTPPDIAPGYPSNGARLAPAWRRLWLALEAGPQTGPSLIHDRDVRGDVAEGTIRTLLQQARRAGLLERTYIVQRATEHAPQRRIAVYSIKAADGAQ